MSQESKDLPASQPLSHLGARGQFLVPLPAVMETILVFLFPGYIEVAAMGQQLHFILLSVLPCWETQTHPGAGPGSGHACGCPTVIEELLLGWWEGARAARTHNGPFCGQRWGDVGRKRRSPASSRLCCRCHGTKEPWGTQCHGCWWQSKAASHQTKPLCPSE